MVQASPTGFAEPKEAFQIMRMPGCEQRILDALEDALEATEPVMAAKFAIFACLAEDEEPASPECPTRRQREWWRSPGLFMIFPLLASMALAVFFVVSLR
jgi:hypothetical protein